MTKINALLRQFSLRFAAIGLAALGLHTATVPALAEPAYELTPMAEGLDHPWGLAFLPNGDMLVTERAGRLRVIRNGALDPNPVSGVPEVYGVNQGGLLEVALDPDFATNNVIYLSYAYGTPDANTTRLAKGVFDGTSLSGVQVIFEATPMRHTSAHYGGRIAFLPDGTFLLTLGDGFDFREQAQVKSDHLGKIVRLTTDGASPAGNPFVDDQNAMPEIWSYGHRNVQGIVFDARNEKVYAHEHGPFGGDELNLIEPGKNYGWPIATYGLDYSGARVSPYTEKEGTEQPLKHWSPSIAPSGLAIYDGDKFPAWQGDLYVSALVPGDVRRVDMENGVVAGEEILFAELEERIRHVVVGPAGFLYLLTDNPEGRVLKVSPTSS